MSASPARTATSSASAAEQSGLSNSRSSRDEAAEEATPALELSHTASADPLMATRLVRNAAADGDGPDVGAAGAANTAGLPPLAAPAGVLPSSLSTGSAAYADHCSTLGISPSPAVDVAIRAAEGSGTLALRGLSLGSRGLTAMCRALTDAFSHPEARGVAPDAASPASAAVDHYGIGTSSSPSPTRHMSPSRPASPPQKPAGSDTAGTAAAAAAAAGALSHVIVSSCYLGDAGCTELCCALAGIYATSPSDGPQRLRVLDLSGNGIRDASPIVDLVTRCPASSAALERVVLEWNKLGNCASTLRLLLLRFVLCESLAHVNLSNNLLPPTAAEAVGAFIAEAPALRSLNLSWNSLGPSAGAHLIASLQRCNSITQVELGGNGLQRGDIEAVAARLAANDRTRAAAAASERQAKETEHRVARLHDELDDVRLQLAAAEADARDLRRDLDAALSRADTAEARAERAWTESNARMARLQEQHEDAVSTAAASRKQAVQEAADASSRVSQAYERADKDRADAEAAKSALRSELNEVRQQLSEAESKLSRASASASASEQSASMYRDELATLRAELKELKAERTEHEASRIAADERSARATSDAAAAKADAATLRDRLVEVTAQLRSAEGNHRDVQSELDASKREAERSASSASKAHEDAMRAAAAEHERALRRQTDAAAAADRRAAGFEDELRRATAKASELTGEVDDLKAKIAERDAAASVAAVKHTQELSLARADLARVEAQKAACDGRLKAAQEESARQAEEHGRRLAQAIEDMAEAGEKRRQAGGGGDDEAVRRLERELREARDANKRLKAKMQAQAQDMEARLMDGVRAAIRGGGGGGGGGQASSHAEAES